MISSKILEQLEQLPESLQAEVLHYAICLVNTERLTIMLI